MNDIFTAPFLTEMRQTAANMYRLGWDERNGGNISLLLDEAEAQKYLDTTHILRTLPLGFDAAALVGKYFLVTGTGKYFKNVDGDPETNLGLVRISNDGQNAELLWGYKDGGRFMQVVSAKAAAQMLSRYRQRITSRIYLLEIELNLRNSRHKIILQPRYL